MKWSPDSMSRIEKNITLNQRLGESVADNIIADVCEGLAQTQKEKMLSLAEGVEFESEEKYRESLKTLRESYFPAKSLTEETETPQMISEEALLRLLLDLQWILTSEHFKSPLNKN